MMLQPKVNGIGNKIKRFIVSGIPVCIAYLGLSTSPSQVVAADEWYFTTDLGVVATPDITVTGTDNDWSTQCDKIINPDELEVVGGCGSPPPPTLWRNELDGGVGVLTGFALGRRWGALRAEGEYFYRTTTYDERSETIIGDVVTLNKLDQEIQIADGGVDDVMSHSLFANFYYDFTSSSRFTSYLGIGAGLSRVSLDYFSRWKRNDDPDAITTFVDPALRQKVAGVTTLAMAKLTDTLMGYQGIAGLDYQISDPLALGLKVRWASFREFEDDRVWDQLRSHDSTVGRGFRVRYRATTNDVQFLGVSLNLKYRF